MFVKKSNQLIIIKILFGSFKRIYLNPPIK